MLPVLPPRSSDPRFAAQINNVKAGFSTPGVPTFEELYMAIINRPYTEADSIWTTLRNPYNMQASMKSREMECSSLP